MFFSSFQVVILYILSDMVTPAMQLKYKRWAHTLHLNNRLQTSLEMFKSICHCVFVTHFVIIYNQIPFRKCNMQTLFFSHMQFFNLFFKIHNSSILKGVIMKSCFTNSHLQSSNFLPLLGEVISPRVHKYSRLHFVQLSQIDYKAEQSLQMLLTFNQTPPFVHFYIW